MHHRGGRHCHSRQRRCKHFGHGHRLQGSVPAPNSVRAHSCRGESRTLHAFFSIVFRLSRWFCSGLVVAIFPFCETVRWNRFLVCSCIRLCHVLTTVPHDDNASGTSLGRVSHHQPRSARARCSQHHRHVLHRCSCRLQLLRCAWRRQRLLRPAEEAAIHKRNSRVIVLLHSLQPRDQRRIFFRISWH